VKKPSKVITLTPAPSLDRTYRLSVLTPGEVHRARAVHSEFAGKGVNVTRALLVGGVSSVAIAPIGRNDSDHLPEDGSLVSLETGQSVRVCITLLEDGGQTTKINEQPPSLSSLEWDTLCELTIDSITPGESQWLLLAGTIPASESGTPLALVELFQKAREKGVSIALDTAGPSLHSATRSGLPDFIKPNALELAECVGRPLRTLGEVMDAAREVVSWGVGQVVVSLGSDGVLGATPNETVHAWTGPVTVLNTIGAGDASVAGYLARTVSHPGDFLGAVRQGVAWGAHKVQQETSQLRGLRGVPDTSFSLTPDRSTILREPGG